MNININSYSSAKKLFDTLNSSMDEKNLESVELIYDNKNKNWDMVFSRDKPGIFDKIFIF